MDWVLASMAGAILIAFVSVLDKRILMAHVPGVMGFLAFVGAIQILIAAVAVIAVPWQSGTSAYAITICMVSGLSWGCGLVLMFIALRGLEVSRVAVGLNTTPVFVAVIETLFLGQYLGYWHWLAIFLVVAGGGLVMIERNVGKDGGKHVVAIMFVFLSSAAMGVGLVTSNIALEEMSFWNVFALRSLFLGSVLLAAGFTSQGMKQLKVIFLSPKAITLILATEAVIAPVAMYAMLLGLSLGPASLVATLFSTRPVFVLIITTLLSTRIWNLMNEPLDKQVIALKCVSTSIVVLGVSILILA